MDREIRIALNRHAAASTAPYAREAAKAMPPACFEEADCEIATWPDYTPTPLIALPGLASELGVAAIDYKDESARFGLGSFKPLGGAYAVARVLIRELERQGIASGVTSRDLAAGRYAAHTRAMTVASATDGNHGRAVAWGARAFGCRCVIYIGESVSEERRAAIASYGADVIRVPGTYDDGVRHTFSECGRNRWIPVQDTAIGDYRDIPRNISAGYGVLGGEILRQLRSGVVENAPSLPTHAIVQTGVGGLAAAVCARLWIGLGARRPRFLTFEPANADCALRSLAAGRPVEVAGDVDSLMAGLSCGVLSDLAWEVLREGAFGAIAIGDDWARDGMRRLADPVSCDPPIVGGECSGGAVGTLLALRTRPDLRTDLGIDASSRILLIGTEGATAPRIYHDIVGRTAEEVRMSRRS